jgi:4-hydroxy-3-polyprenylbenzoate decarboxylase
MLAAILFLDRYDGRTEEAIVTATSTRYYADLRDYLAVLDQRGKLVRIDCPINKDTELHPLVRLQYRGLPDSERRAFLFEHVVDSTGRRYDIPVAVGCMAGSRDIYAIGMQVENAAQITARWLEAQQHPIPPVLVDRGPVRENIYTGADLERIGGVGILPVPISTPGFDNAPYTSASHWLCRDPESGRYNLGNYRGQIKAPLRLGCFTNFQSDIWAIWKKYRARGEPMPAALVSGVAPHISYCSVAKLSPHLDEYHVAGGIALRPVELVRCETVDLHVPAHAEIIVEGIIPTDVLELEGPFGEFTGYMAKTEYTLFMNVTAITHRHNPIWQAFVSQFPPSESTVIMGVTRENLLLKLLRVDQDMDNVLQVAAHEGTGGGYGLIAIQVKDPKPGQVARMFEMIPRVWRAKLTIAVDDDIDPRDADAINWALAFRFQPARDACIEPWPEHQLDPSVADPAADSARTLLEDQATRSSCLLIDATRKWPYPPTSLPTREYMDRALALWKQQGLPDLQLKDPWYGENLGYWPAEREAEAALAVHGRYYETGEKFAGHRHALQVDSQVARTQI